MELTFDAETHEYALKGSPLPGVTEALAECGLIDRRWFEEYATNRGSIIHRACELHDLGTLDEESVDPAIAGYFAAYKAFLADSGVMWTAIEQAFADDSLRFAGRPDRLTADAVYDIKSGAKLPHHAYQLAAYSLLTGRQNRFGLYLNEDGTYKLEQYKRRSDFDIFRAAVAIYHAKRGKA